MKRLKLFVSHACIDCNLVIRDLNSYLLKKYYCRILNLERSPGSPDPAADALASRVAERRRGEFRKPSFPGHRNISRKSDDDVVISAENEVAANDMAIVFSDLVRVAEVTLDFSKIPCNNILSNAVDLVG
jgi:hypothetical protein